MRIEKPNIHFRFIQVCLVFLAVFLIFDAVFQSRSSSAVVASLFFALCLVFHKMLQNVFIEIDEKSVRYKSIFDSKREILFCDVCELEVYMHVAGKGVYRCLNLRGHNSELIGRIPWHFDDMDEVAECIRAQIKESDAKAASE